jgi:biopolymer transport protein ExbB/TolQ
MKKTVLILSLAGALFGSESSSLENILREHESIMSAIIDKKVEQKDFKALEEQIRSLYKKLDALESKLDKQIEPEQKEPYSSKYENKFKDYIKSKK